MNEQAVKSLAFYVSYLNKVLGYDVQQIQSHSADANSFIVNELNDNPIPPRWKENNWHESFDLLPIDLIDIGACFEEALASVFGGGVAVVKDNASEVVAGGAGYFERYVEKECKTDEEKENLRSDVESFWTRLKGYQTEQNGHRAYGLAVGRVQSGKTRNYIGLMFKAIDEGYNTIIVLTSKNNQLAIQTHDRVVGWFNDLGLPSVYELTKEESSGDGIEWIGGSFRANGIHVGVIIKNVAGHLLEFENWLNDISPDDLKSMNLLLIDDESDAATPNSNVTKESEITKDADVSALSNKIRGAGENDITQVPLVSAKYGFVADWVDRLNEEKSNISSRDYDVIHKWLAGFPSYKQLFNTILRDEEKKRILMLTGTFGAAGYNLAAAGAVVEIFNHQKRKAALHQKLFRDFLNYVFNVKVERSAINDLIVRLVGSVNNKKSSVFQFQQMIYAGYTATPFANLLNEEPVTEDPLCPDCIKPLSTSSKYFGLDRIYGEQVVYGAIYSHCRMNIVREIGEEEYSGWVIPVQKSRIRENDIPELGSSLIYKPGFTEEGDGAGVKAVEWKSLKDAIKWAFCTAAARRVIRLRGEHSDDYADIKYRWTTMLFNISHLSDQESGTHKIQQRLVQSYVDAMRDLTHRREFLDECMDMWSHETASFTGRDFQNACPGYGTFTAYPDADSVRQALEEWFLPNYEKVSVIQMNAATGDRAIYKEAQSGCGGDVLWFVCGGNAISRGLTLEGLTVSYYDRIKPRGTVDTITQMGRWFGYRQGYELLPRIWMTDDTIAVMKDICRIENQLHDELNGLFESEDHASIRDGRDVVKIRYFGRRLTRFDANSRVVNGSSSHGVFSNVAVNPDLAFAKTRNLLVEQLRLDAVSTDLPHTRYGYIWKSVGSAIVSGYLREMGEYCFREASRSQAKGLLRSIARHPTSWTVVVGNPRINDAVTVSGIEGLENVHARNNKIKELSDEAVRIGHEEHPVYAYLACLPEEIVSEASAAIQRDTNRKSISDVNRAYDIAKRNGRTELLNPVLVIEFVKGGAVGKFYVQVSFCWPGLDSGSYCEAIINTNTSDLCLTAIDIVCHKKYISLYALKRVLAAKFPAVSEIDRYGHRTLRPDSVKELKNGLDEEIRSANARIGITEGYADPNTEPHMADKIIYSVEWINQMRSCAPTLSDRRIIGVDLFNNYGTNSARMKVEDYDKIIADVPLSRGVPNWTLFWRRAQEDRLAFNGVQDANGLVRGNVEESAGLQHGNSESSKYATLMRNLEPDAITEDKRLRALAWLWVDELTGKVRDILINEGVETVGQFIRFVDKGGFANKMGVGPKKIEKYKKLCGELKAEIARGAH